MPLFAEMRKNPRVVAVKNSSMPVQDIQMFKDAGGEGFVVFNGPDEQFVGGRCMGADGGIGGTYGVMPELYLKMDECIRSGNISLAQKIQYTCDRIIYAMWRLSWESICGNEGDHAPPRGPGAGRCSSAAAGPCPPEIRQRWTSALE